VICGKKGLEEVGEDGEIHLIFGEMGITWECKTLMERVVREWRKMYVLGV
jgi:hypothetical protein